ncbi:MAG: hypothetical protein MZW92_59255 [Comamonadaceae bacterium]|nr:hypothetical protein [Comamonadaceae bacterium]
MASFDGIRVHVGAVHHRGPLAILQHANDTRLADARLDLEAKRLQFLREDRGRAGFHEPKFGMLMQVLEQLLEPSCVGIDESCDGIHLLGDARLATLRGRIHRARHNEGSNDEPL